ncbi:hypothetical protein SLA2020_002060 [Shorea laevis]
MQQTASTSSSWMPLFIRPDFVGSPLSRRRHPKQLILVGTTLLQSLLQMPGVKIPFCPASIEYALPTVYPLASSKLHLLWSDWEVNTTSLVRLSFNLCSSVLSLPKGSRLQVFFHVQ